MRAAVNLVRSTRPGEADAPEVVREFVQWGAGPRASQALVVAAKARAVLHGRTAASVEDVKALARPILRHRVVTNFHAESEGMSAVQVVDALVDRLAV